MDKKLTIPVRGGALSVRVAGQGPAILFVHGFPLDHQMWTGQLPLTSDFRCIMPDLRGFGASQAEVGEVLTMTQFAEDLQSVLQQVAANQQVCVCGLSMGGYIAFELWQRCADRISHLVLCDTRAAADTMEVARGRELTAQKIAVEGSRELVTSMLGKLFGPSAPPQCRVEVERILQSVRASSLMAALRGMAQRTDFTPRLAEIRIPALVICGHDDVITPPVEMRQMAGQLADSQFVEVDSAGHLAPLEQPELVNARIASFIS